MHLNGLENSVKKAMYNIMTGSSVIYSKTDLCQICNKPNVRSEAVKRLVDANLLQHGDRFWVEPSRNKKEKKNESRKIFREGWIK